MPSASWRVALIVGALLVARPALGAAWGGASADEGAGSHVLVGGGVSGFTSGPAQDLWKRGSTWDARLGVGDRSWVGGELAYVGSYHVAKPGAHDLVGNGGDAILRLQYPYAVDRWLVEPFAFGGIGFDHLTLRDMPGGTRNTDTIGDVPFGAGVEVGAGQLLLDARFTYRATFNEDLAALGGSNVKMRDWDLTAAIGFRF